ncbi:MAG: hypothetical protein ACK5LS_11385 [Propioniciclava sp.]
MLPGALLAPRVQQIGRDRQGLPVGAAQLSLPRPTDPPPARAPAPDDTAALADLLTEARRPVILAGRGGREAGAELRALAEASGALLATSAVANGLFHDDPFCLGISGGFSSPLAAELITEAGLIVAFGCALNMWTMRHGALIGSDATLVQVDTNPAALGRLRPVARGIVGDSAATAAAVTALLRQRPDATDGYRSAERAEQIRTGIRWNDVNTDDLSTGERIDPRVLSARLDQVLPRERVVAVDSGNFMGYPSQYLGVPDEFGFSVIATRLRIPRCSALT